MESAQGITKARSYAKSCTACRLSKIKCVMPDGASNDENGCNRCSRLGLKCIFEESKRGRQCVSRDKARLGPAVRALLRATTPLGDTSNEAQVLATSAEVEQTQATDADVLCWCGDQCQRKMVLSIESSGGRLALLKHWLLIGVRSGNCGLLGNVLLVAHACGVTLDDFVLPMPRPLPPAPALSLPPFIAEWLHSRESLCCMRTQTEGAVSWQPNAAFVREVGDEAVLQSRLEASHPGISQQVDYLICTAELFLTLVLHPDDRLAMARLNGMLWSGVARPDAPEYDGWCCAEASAAVMVRCLRRQDAAAVTGAAQADRSDDFPLLCSLRGRSAILRNSRAVCTVLSLTPAAKPVPVPLPVGYASWPMNDVCMALMSAAQNDGHGVGYDALNDLGLDFSLDEILDENAMVQPLTQSMAQIHAD